MKDGELNEDELFDQAVESTEAPEAPAPEPQEEQPEQPRDEQGRFAEKSAEEPEAAPDTSTAPAADAPMGRVPAGRLREEAEARRRLETDLANERAERAALRQRLEALERPAPKVEQPKAERPDPLLDPEGYAKAVREDIRNELLAERREESLQNALEANPEEFKAAYTAAQQANDPALKARMQASRDPGKTLLAWHKERQTMQEVGSDPKAWLEKQLEEKLKDPAFLAKAVERARGNAPAQQSDGRPNIRLAPSMSGVSRANAQLRPDGDLDDNTLFDATTS